MADIESNIHVNIDTTGALASLKGLQRQISTFHSTMQKSGAASAATSASMQSNLMNQINASGKFSASMQRIQTTSESFTTSLEKNKLSMGEYFRYAGASTKTFGKLFKSEFSTIDKVARERVKTLQTQYIKMGRDANGALQSMAVRPLTLDMKNLGTQTAIAAQKTQIFNQLAKQGSTNLLNFGKNTQWAGRQLMVGFSIPLGIAAAAAGREFMKLEEQAIRFKRVYGDTFTPTSEADAMVEQVKELALQFAKYGVSVEETLGLAADAAAMGRTGAELLAQVTQASRLAVLGGVEHQQALETTTSLTSAFGTATEDLASKIDFLNAVENQTVTSIDDLTIAIPKAGPVIKQLGGNVEDLAFFLTAMKEGGINASEGANALKSGMASIINPTSEATKMLAGFNININDLVTKNAGNAKGMVMDLATALDGLDPLNRAQAIETMFGKFQFARISTLFQNVIKDGTQAQRVLELSNKTTAELALLSEKELGNIADSPMYKFQASMEKFKASLAPIGEEFLKAITPVIEWGKTLIDGFNSWGDGAKQFTIIAVTTIAGIGPIILMTFGLIANGAANLIKMFLLVGNIFRGTGTSSKILGEQTSYLSQEQLTAAGVAASLDQTHMRLTQTFTSEAGAINSLTAAYTRAIAVQGGFNPATAVARGAKKMATGGVVRGPGTGTSDSIPAMLSNGETVIPAKQSKRYGGLLSGIISGNIPGFAKGRIGSGSSGRIGKSNFAVTRPYGANVANSSGLESLQSINVGSMADVSSLYAQQIMKSSGTSVAKIGEEIKQWELANKAAIDEATDAVNSGTPAAKAFSKLTKKFKSDMDSAGGAFSSFSKSAERMAPELKKDLEIAKSEAKRLGLNLRKSADTASLAKALPNNIAAQSLAKPGGYQRYSRTRAATSAYFGGSEGIETNGVARFMINKSATPDSLAYKAGSSQEHLATTEKQSRNLMSQSQMRSENKKAGELIYLKTSQGVSDAVNEAAQAASPSKKAKQAGKNIADGALLGIESGVKPAKVVGEKIANAVTNKNPAFGAVAAPVVRAANAGQQQFVGERVTKMFPGGINMDSVRNSLVKGFAPVKLIEVDIKNMARTLTNARRPTQLLIDSMNTTKAATIKAAQSVKTFALGVGPAITGFAVKARNAVPKALNAMTNATKTFGNAVSRVASQVAAKSKNMLLGPTDSAGNRMGGGLKSKIGGAGMAASGLVMAGSMIPGKVGETAQGLMGPIMGISAVASLFTMMPAPIAAVIAVLGLLAAGIFFAVKSFDDAKKSGQEMANAMSMTTDKLKGFSEVTGKASATEIRKKEKELAAANLKPGQDEKLAEGKSFLATDPGKAFVADVNKQLSAGRGTAEIAQNVATQLSTAVAQGVMSKEQADNISSALGASLKNRNLTIGINAELNKILGPNGEDLSTDPLRITSEITNRSQKQAKGVGQLAADGQVNPLLADGGRPLVGAAASMTALVGGAALLAPTIAAGTGALAGLAGAATVATGVTATGVGAVAGGIALVGIGIAAATISTISFVEQQKKNVETATLATDIYSNLYSQGLGMVDVINQQYDAQIKSKKALLDQTTNEKDRKRILEDIVTLEQAKSDALKEQNTLNAQTVESAMATKLAIRGDSTNDNVYDDANKAQITDVTYKDDKTGAAMATKAYDAVAPAIANESAQVALQLQISSGEIDPAAATMLVNALSGDTELQAKYTALLETAGDQATINLVSSLTNAGATELTIQTQLRMASGSDDPAVYVEDLNTLISLANDLKSQGIIIDINDGNAKEQLEEIKKSISDFADFLATGVKTSIEVNTYFKSQGFEMTAAQLAYYDSLPPDQQKVYAATYLTISESIDAGTEDGRARIREMYDAKYRPGASNSLRAGGQSAYTKAAQMLAGDQARLNAANSAVNAPVAPVVIPSSLDSGGGGGGAQAAAKETSSMDSIIAKLKEVRKATLSLTEGWDASAKSLSNLFSGSKSIAGFGGMSQSLRAAGASEGLISMVLGMPPEEWEKKKKTLFTFNSSGMITGLKDLAKSITDALAAITLGELAVKQQQTLAATRDQIVAYNKLRAAGMSAAEAEQMVADAQVASAIATAANSKELRELIANQRALAASAKDFAKTTISGLEGIVSAGMSNVSGLFSSQTSVINESFLGKKSPLEDSMKAAQKIIDDIQNAPGGLTDLGAELDRIAYKEDAINKSYDKKAAALDKVAAINDRLISQQKAQMSLAEALSRGDIAAAAAAAQDMQAQNATNNMADQKAALEAARLAEVNALTGNNGMTREEIEQRVLDLKQQISEIENNQIAPAKYRLDLLDQEQQKQIDALTVLGKTQEQWASIQTQIDVARTSTEEYRKAIMDALDAVNLLTAAYGSSGSSASPEDPEAPGSAPSAAPSRVFTAQQQVRWGSRGSTVSLLQRALNKGGAGLAVDGIFGQKTYNAVASFQAKNGLARDGISGPNTWKKLFDLKYYAKGGMVYASQGGSIAKAFARGNDKIPSMLEAGEFVMTKSATDQFGAKNLSKINDGTYKDGSVYNYSVSVNVATDADPTRIARAVREQISNIDSQRIRSNRF
jgi:peptidoglycan hydrolase-like protein with peptidoglycan-binding domain